MTISDHRYWILDRNARHPDLMERMMQRLSVSPSAAARVDGGMAWCEARTKCIFCRCEAECALWLDGKDSATPREFCPNVGFFQHCGASPQILA